MEPKRNAGLDMMKGWLAILMTISHLSCALDYHIKYPIMRHFSAFANLTTFSGFMFCFGYVCWRSYIVTDREDVCIRLLKGAGKTLCAFWISGILFAFFNKGKWEDVLSVIFLQKVPVLSEFLLSFSMVYLLLVFTRRYLSRIDWKSMLALSAVSLCITVFFPINIIISPLLGSIIGTSSYKAFPVLGYFIFFMCGSFFSKYGDKYSILIIIIGAVFTGIFCREVHVTGNYPGRFPPTPLWVLGGVLPVCCYYIVFTLLNKKNIYIKILSFWGRHTLVLLVIGNAFYFLIQGFSQKMAQKMIYTFSDFQKLLLMIFCTFLVSYFVTLAIDKLKHIRLCSVY